MEDHPFARKYLAASTVTLEVADGVSAALPLGRDAIGLALAELYQEAGRLSEAIGVVEAVDPSLIAAVSLAELYVLDGRYDDAVDLTNGISNDDDPSALLVTFRGIALREQGHHTAARGPSRKPSSRSPATPRSGTARWWSAPGPTGRRARTRWPARTWKRVLAEDADYPGVREALAAL